MRTDNLQEMARQINNDAYNKYVNIDFHVYESKAQRTYGDVFCVMKYKNIEVKRNCSNTRGNNVIILLADLLKVLNPLVIRDYCIKSADTEGYTGIPGVYYNRNNDECEIYSEYMKYAALQLLYKEVGYAIELTQEDFLHFRIKRYR